MNKNKSLQKVITLFFRLRRGFKIYIAVSTGFLNGLTLFKEIYNVTKNPLYSYWLAMVAGLFIIAVMLLIMELIRIVLNKFKQLGTKLVSNFRESKLEHVNSNKQ